MYFRILRWASLRWECRSTNLQWFAFKYFPFGETGKAGYDFILSFHTTYSPALCQGYMFQSPNNAHVIGRGTQRLAKCWHQHAANLACLVSFCVIVRITPTSTICQLTKSRATSGDRRVFRLFSGQRGLSTSHKAASSRPFNLAVQGSEKSSHLMAIVGPFDSHLGVGGGAAFIWQ